MAETPKNVNPYKVTTGTIRIGFTKFLLTPDENEAYSCMGLIPKTDLDTINKIKKSVEAFKSDPKAITKWGSKWLASFKTPLRDGDTERDTEQNPEYKGCYFINCNTYTKPGVVDAQLQEIINPAQVYSGCNARISIAPAAFNTDGNKGIKLYLNNVQVLPGGERIGGGGSRPDEDFTAVQDDFLS